jgi:hypothetical protein
MIALGDTYYNAIDWSRVTSTLLHMNPGYTVHVYGDKEVQMFLQVSD